MRRCQSGIPDVFKSQQFWAGLLGVKKQTDFWSFFAKAPLEFQPGTKWTYTRGRLVPEFEDHKVWSDSVEKPHVESVRNQRVPELLENLPKRPGRLTLKS